MNALMHDRAFLISLDILDTFWGVLREDERQDALWAIYECVRSGLSEYETKAARRMHLLNPSQN